MMMMGERAALDQSSFGAAHSYLSVFFPFLQLGYNHNLFIYLAAFSFSSLQVPSGSIISQYANNICFGNSTGLMVTEV